MKCTFTIVKAIINKLLGFHPNSFENGGGADFFFWLVLRVEDIFKLKTS